jgi:hypothetical protein
MNAVETTPARNASRLLKDLIDLNLPRQRRHLCPRSIAGPYTTDVTTDRVHQA